MEVKKNNIDINEKIASVQLIRTERIGPITYSNLIKIYKTASNALENLPKIARNGGCKNYKIYDRSLAEKEIEETLKLGARLVFKNDDDYPRMLRLIQDCPPFLTMFGKIDNSKQFVSIVGSRNASLNSQRFCYKISNEIAKNNIIVCSGMARGIDAKAHEGALDFATIAVLAGGIDVVYPPENQKLYEQIKERGVLISESALGTQPQSMLFPKRNRIIAGLSAATLVIEAAIKSGSLITANAALEYGRDVFAVPGFPEDPRCRGSNMLIKNGALLLETYQDVLDNLRVFEFNDEQNNDYDPQLSIINDEDLDDIRKNILNMLSYTPILIDDLIKSCNNNVQGVLISIIELEVAGKITRLDGQRICLCVEE